MEKGQIWCVEGLPVNSDSMKRVIKNFKENGIKNELSRQSLRHFLKKISDDIILEMYDMDADATLEMLVECFGARIAFDCITCAAGSAFENQKQQIEDLKAEAEENRKALAETRQKADERIDALNKECEDWRARYEAAREMVKELDNALAHYKADLYDFYANNGQLPKYEEESI